MTRPHLPRLDVPDFSAVLRQLLLAAPIRLWALILAGPPLTAFDAWLVWIVWKGDWPAAMAETRLEIIGAALGGHVVLVAIVVVALASVKLEAATKLGTISIGGDDHDDPAPAAFVETTTTTKVAAPAAPPPPADPA